MFVPCVARVASGVRGVVVLALVVAAAGEQYAGVPQYSADYERSDYRAPALDYTLEEEERAHGDADRTPGYALDAEPWDLHKPTRETTLSTDELEETVKRTRVGRRRHRGRRDEVPSEPPPRRRRPPPQDAPRRAHDDYDELVYTGERLEDEAPVKDVRAARKPRERLFAPPPLPRSTTEQSTLLAPEEEEGGLMRRPTDAPDSDREDPDYYSGVERAREVLRRPTLPPALPASPAASNTWSMPTLAAAPEYNEYYEHKRFNNKLKPNLARRSSTTAADVPSPRLRFQTRAEQPARPPWGGRRADGPLATPSSTAAAYSPVAFVAETNGSAPSLAELSRLSILRKAQQKERAGGGGTTKPPVLLQVTRRAHTVVLVQAGEAWQRAREVSGDSPDTLAKVKRLMRQKLVAGAKSIRDLTDNWEDTVCDYIDTAMLEEASSSAPPAPPASPLSLATLALLHYCSL